MKIYDNKKIKPDYISFIGINYNMPGQYITDCYYNYHFYNILSLDEIDSIDYDSIMFIILDKYIKKLNLNIKFNYDFKYMQEYIKEFDLNKKAFASNKTIKEILKEFYLEV